MCLFTRVPVKDHDVINRDTTAQLCRVYLKLSGIPKGADSLMNLIRFDATTSLFGILPYLLAQ